MVRLFNMWKIIEEFPYYSINEYGEVKRNEYTKVDQLGRTYHYKDKLIKIHPDKDGYCTVTLVAGVDKPKICKVHRLVAIAFIENPDNLPCINHKDEDKTNNCVDNLEWCTVAYNNSYNDKHLKSGLKRRIVIYSVADDGDIKYYSGVCEAAKAVNGKSSNISAVLNGRLKTAYGYKWFKEEVV